jgi:hypothetical protein
MKLRFSDYVISFIILTLPVFGVLYFGLSFLSDLSDLSIFGISFIISIIDYSNIMTSLRKDKIIEQLQDRVKKLEDGNKG